jgi:large repetitive protein
VNVSVPIPLKFITNYNLLVDGIPYASTLKGCTYDTTFSYSYFTIPSRGKSGPYALNYWVVNQDTFKGAFNTVKDLVNMMNTWDAKGNWVLDSLSYSIVGGNKLNKYNDVKISRPRDGAYTLLKVTTKVLPLETCINVSNNDHQLTLTDKITGCKDTVFIAVTKLINVSPVAVNDTISTKEDVVVVGTVANNDTDKDGNLNPSSFKVVDAPKNGKITMTANGAYIYTPNLDFNGVDSVHYEVCDLGMPIYCAQATLIINITPVNDRPVVPIVSISTVEDSAATVCTTINDVDSNAPFYVKPCGVKNGNASSVISGNKLCVTYTPKANFNGVDTACFIICDGAGACDTIKIAIVVAPVNDKPVVVTPTMSTVRDSAVTVCTTINDPDLGDTFTVTTCGAKNGTQSATIVGNQVCMTYTPKANFFGVDTACYVVCDKGGLCETVKIPVVVKWVNDTPSVKLTPVTIAADSTRKFCFDILDKDVNDTHTATLCSTQKGFAQITVTNGQVCITYKAPKLFTGKDTICVFICDNLGACRKVLIPITVTACNDQLPPVIQCPAKIEVSIIGTMTSDPSQFVVYLGQNKLSDNCDGLKMTFRDVVATDDCGVPTISQISGPTKDSIFHEGSYTMVYEAKDESGKTSQCQVEIVVTPINLIDATAMTVCPNDALTLKANNYKDATYKWTGPRNIGNEGVLLTVPRINTEEMGLFVVSAKTGSCTFNDSITVTFRGKPTVNNDAFTTTTNKELKNNVLTNDTTSAKQKFTVKLVSSPSFGKLVFNADGSFVYQPRAEFTGLDNFVYEVCATDCPGACERATATIKVINEKNQGKGMNVISPNGDGVNDGLEIEGFDPDAPNNQSEIVIYNQWGNVVYRTTSYRNDWQGTFKDSPLPDGTYYYVFKKSPDAVPIKDFVTIIR